MLNINILLSSLIKKEMVTQSQNYSFMEQDYLLFNGAKILAQNNFDYKLLMRFGSSSSNVSSGPVEQSKK